MAVSRESLAAVLGDLRKSREQLVLNLEDMDRTIACLERMYKISLTDGRIGWVPPKSSPTVGQGTRPMIELETNQAPKSEPAVPEPQDPQRQDQRAARTEIPGILLWEAVVAAAGEARHDQTQMSKRVMELRPGTSIGSAMTQVSTMLKNKKLHKGDDLIIRNVVDGKVVGLPVSKEEEAVLSRSLYDKDLGVQN